MLDIIKITSYSVEARKYPITALINNKEKNKDILM